MVLGKSPITTLVGVLIVAVLGLVIFSMVFTQTIKDGEKAWEYKGLGIEDIQPIFKWIVAGIAVFFGWAVISKMRIGIRSPAEFFTLIIAVIILYYLLTAILPGLEVIEKPIFALVNP